MTIQQWHVAKLIFDPSAADTISSLLFDCGSAGTIEEKSSGEEIIYASYFTDQTSIDDLKLNLSNALQSRGISPQVIASITTIGFNPHDEAWKQHFRPHEIVPGIIVRPTWESTSASKGMHEIVLDPGMAFGTGLHETTRLCAQAIFDLTAQGNTPQSLLDVGCGSGILSLVAHALGINRIAAIDDDPIACDAAAENFARNDATIAIFPQLTDVNALFHLVVANILLLPLKELRAELLHRTAPGGHLILSGITRDQAQDLQDAFDLPIVHAYQDGEWSCIVCRNSLPTKSS